MITNEGSIFIANEKMTTPSRKLWHTAEASLTVTRIEKLFIIESFNLDLQAGIWFGNRALSPIITFPHSTMV